MRFVVLAIAFLRQADLRQGPTESVSAVLRRFRSQLWHARFSGARLSNSQMVLALTEALGSEYRARVAEEAPKTLREAEALVRKVERGLASKREARKKEERG